MGIAFAMLERITMKTIVLIVTAVVVAIASMPASAASKHKRHAKAAAAQQTELPAPSLAAIPFHAAAIARWAIRSMEHRPVSTWRRVRTTRFMETAATETRSRRSISNVHLSRLVARANSMRTGRPVFRSTSGTFRGSVWAATRGIY